MKKRNYQYDLMRAFAIISVLIIHSALRYNETYLEIQIGGWFSTFFRPCIAIFLFLTGALYNNENNTFEYTAKKIKRVLFPYLFFSVFEILYSILVTSNIDIFKTLANIILGNTMGIYYYVFVIICIFLIAYFFKKVNFFVNNQLILFIVLFFTNLIYNAYYFDVTSSLGLSSNLVEFISLRSIFVWLMYFYMGVLYKKYELHKLISRYRNTIIFFWLAIFITYNLLWFFNIGNLHGYISVIGTFYSMATIFLLLSIPIKPNKAIMFLSQNSYTIYLSHIFFVYFLMELESMFNLNFPVWFNFISFIFSLIGSYIVCKIGKIIFKSKSLYLIGS